MQRYRRGHNEAVLKTVCPKGHVGSNPTLCVELLTVVILTKRIKDAILHMWIAHIKNLICRGIEEVITRRSWKPFVRKGTWVRIPPSAFEGNIVLMKSKLCFSFWKKWRKSGFVPRSIFGTKVDTRFCGLWEREIHEIVVRKNVKKLEKSCWQRLTWCAILTKRSRKAQKFLKEIKKLKKLEKSCWQQ